MIFRNRQLCKFALIVAILLMPSLCFAKPYFVAKGDKLKVSIFQWPQYSEESRIDDSGTISLPIMGIRRLPVSGLNLAQIEKEILKKLSTVTEMRNVAVFVDVAEYRPISILGAVNTPGRYGYTSGTSVLHAVAIAGGFLIPGQMNASQKSDPYRQFVNQTHGRERLDTLKVELWGAIARRARLVADRNGLDAIKFPAELLEHEKQSGQRGITLREIKILETDRRQIKSEIRILNEQIQIVKKEIGILVLHRKSVGKSVKTLESEVARQRTLVGKGLARRLTIMTVDSRLSDMRGEYRRTSVSLMRSKTHLSEIEKSILTAKNQREKDIETALVATESVIDVINNKLRHQRSILANQLGGPAGSDDTSGNAIVIGYSIVRDSSDGGKQELTVEDTTPLKPGDILKVRLSSVTRGLGGMDTSNLQTGARSSACESNGSATSTDSECGPRATRARADTGSTKLNMGVANVR